MPTCEAKAAPDSQVVKPDVEKPDAVKPADIKIPADVVECDHPTEYFKAGEHG